MRSATPHAIAATDHDCPSAASEFGQAMDTSPRYVAATPAHVARNRHASGRRAAKSRQQGECERKGALHRVMVDAERVVARVTLAIRCPHVQRVGEPRSDPQAREEEQWSRHGRKGNCRPSEPRVWRQPTYDHYLEREHAREPEEPCFLRDHRRDAERQCRDQKLGNSRGRRTWSHHDEHKGRAHDHRREQPPPGLEHLRPIGIPRHGKVDQPESWQDDPTDGEQTCEPTRGHAPHRHSLHGRAARWVPNGITPPRDVERCGSRRWQRQSRQGRSPQSRKSRV